MRALQKCSYTYILLYMDVFNYIHVIMVKDFFCNFYCNDKIY